MDRVVETLAWNMDMSLDIISLCNFGGVIFVR